MAGRAPFLNTIYSAYHHRERPPEDEELTRVGPGTPCGEYLRRFWQPVTLASELGDLPRRVRILGEDLVAYRDKERQHRPLGIALPASRHLARVRPDRRQGHPLLLPRLAVRSRRYHPRDARRA